MDQKILLAIPSVADDKIESDAPASEVAETQEVQPTASKTSGKGKSQLAKAKTSIKKTITKDDTFRVNDKFRSQLKRITINSIQKKESKKDSDSVH